jgi:anti-sigma B factor antagonist
MKLMITDLSERCASACFTQNSLDASNVKGFREGISASLATKQVVLLDMQSLSFVDSSGLGALLACLRTMNAKEGKLVLFGITRPVMALFELVRMHRLFSIHASLELALEEVNSD